MSKYIDDAAETEPYDASDSGSVVSATEESEDEFEVPTPKIIDSSKKRKRELLAELERRRKLKERSVSVQKELAGVEFHPQSQVLRRSESVVGKREVIDLASDSEDSAAEMPPPPKKKKAPKRILQRKKFGFTIPQSKNSPEVVIAGVLARWPGVTYVVSREKHKDGGTHYHGLVKAERAIAVYNNLIAGEVAHFSDVWNEAGWNKYVQKDGEVWTNKKKDTDIQDITNKEELWEWAKAKMGKRAASDFPKVHETWRLLRHKERQEWVSRYKPDSFKHNKRIIQWVEDSARQMAAQDRMKVLVIIGDSRIGKTEYVRFLLSCQPGGHCYFQSRQSAKLLNDVSGDCCYMVVDDMLPNKEIPGSKDCPPLKAWTQAHESVQTSKYCPEVKIPSRAVVVLLNEEPNWLQDPYWKANTVVIWARGKFYGNPPSDPADM